MELRSSRSRSKTPFTMIESFDKELIDKGNHVDKIVMRTTRKTRTIKSNEKATSSTDEYSSSHSVQPIKKIVKSEKSARRYGFKTSDYSSEDGENEVSSTKVINQNKKNQFIEDAKEISNGNNSLSPALNLYLKTDRYWDQYPKTDWTYSYHSKDRVELAPGVIAMPNMSRRTIHSTDSASFSENVADKQTNTDLMTDHRDSYYSRYSNVDQIQPKKLFNNNREDYFVARRKTSVWTTVRRYFYSVLTSILTVFYYVHGVQTSWFAKLHNLSSRVMLMDTWILRKKSARDKSTALVALCLIPLLLFGGWWTLSSLGSLIYGAYFNSTSLVNSPTESINIIPPIYTEDHNELDVNMQSNNYNSMNYQPVVEEKIIKTIEKIYVEPPNANEIAAHLTSNQLNAIAAAIKNSININEEIDTGSIVQKILAAPSIQNIINNYNDISIHQSGDEKTDNSDVTAEMWSNQQKVISSLHVELNKIKDELSSLKKSREDKLDAILAEFKSEQAQSTAHLTYQLTKCCRKSIINVEAYVDRILTSLLNNPEFLQNQAGLTGWLQKMFIAKQDLELKLANLTQNLNSRYDALVENNGKMIMDEVAAKIMTEMNNKIREVRSTKEDKYEITLGSVSDERIREIVASTLAIYDADKTGLVDYAMEPMGGQILTTRCTENFHSGKAVVSVLGIPLWYPVNSPRTVITPGINPGECWAFQNFPGFLVIKLSNKIKVEAFSLEHISKLLVPNGKIDSAPKEFEIYGLRTENDRDPVKLGSYEYNYNGEPLQHFQVQNEGHAFDIIEVRIISNHGNPNYTCLYRFRVHGKLSAEPT